MSLEAIKPNHKPVWFHLFFWQAMDFWEYSLAAMCITPNPSADEPIATDVTRCAPTPQNFSISFSVTVTTLALATVMSNLARSDPRLSFWPGWHSELFCRWARLGHMFPLGSALCSPLTASLMRELGPTASSSNGNKSLLVITQATSKWSRKGDFGRVADCSYNIQLLTYYCQWCSLLSYKIHLLAPCLPFHSCGCGLWENWHTRRFHGWLLWWHRERHMSNTPNGIPDKKEFWSLMWVQE